MTLFGRLFTLFVVVPILELVLLIQIGRAVGLLPTVALVLATGAAGAWLARSEGLRVLYRFQNELAEGRVPGQALLDAIAVLIGGALLLTPGVLTDVLGFALLVPVTRRWLQARVRRRIERGLASGSIRVVTFGAAGPPFGGRDDGGSGVGSRPGGVGGGTDRNARHVLSSDEDSLDPRHEIRVQPRDS